MLVPSWGSSPGSEVIFTTEPLWAAIFAVWLINEPFSSVDAVGPEAEPWEAMGSHGGWGAMAVGVGLLHLSGQNGRGK